MLITLYIPVTNYTVTASANTFVVFENVVSLSSLFQM